MAGKRKAPPSPSSSSEDEGRGRARAADSSGWEDEDSSEAESHRLRIALPQRKKVRKKRQGSPRRGDVNIPEDILSECSKMFLDKKLDDKAASINWGRKQVKMVLRAIVQSDEMMNMLRHAGLAPGEKEPPAEPKMTRAMARRVEAEGLTVPYLVEPATPPRLHDPELALLAAGELQPEEEGDKDEEYRPDLDPFADDDDDDSLFQSEEGTPRSQREESFNTSCLSTPASIGTPRSFATPDSSTFKRPFLARGSMAVHRHAASRSLDFDAAPLERSYSTRSNNPLTEVRIEDIEQQFIPFDITPDMYDPVRENDDYSEFLKDMFGGSSAEVEYNEEEDTEFVYCPDEADEQTADPEELRNDKATKVTKKEVAELMAELCEFADSSLRSDADNKKKKVVKKKKAPLPGDQIFEAIKEHTEAAAKEVKVVEVMSVEEVVVATEQVTAEQRSMIAEQMSQHVQLATQMGLMASHNETWRGVRRQCEAMLGEVASASLQPGSVAASSNLYTSLAVLRSWEELGQDPTTISKNKNSKKYKKRNFIFDLSDPLVDFMAKQKVFYYPSLLPTCALAQDTSRISWTPGEDALLALALANTAPTLTKTGLTELSYALQAKYMRAKSAVQIRARIKNLKLRDSEEAMNPVVKFIKTGEASAARVAITTRGNGSQSLVDMLREGDAADFPPMWTRRIHDLLQRRSGAEPPRRLQPFPALLQPAQVQQVILVTTVPSPAAASPPPAFLRPILCVDGQTGTPSSTSEGEEVPPIKSPVKRLLLTRTLPYKSPVKAASERILRKYSMSPHKRPLRPLHIRERRRTAPGPPAPPPAPLSPPPNLPPRPRSPPPSEEGSADMVDSVDTPTTLARRKSRHQKEAELTLQLLGPLETAEEKESREARESQEMLEEIRRALVGSEHLQAQFAAIIAAVEAVGTVGTYTALHSLLEGHPAVQETLLDLLSDPEARELGAGVYEAHQQRVRMKQFVVRLGVAYRHQPAYHARLLRELDTLCSDPSLTPASLHTAASRLFKHNTFLLEQFLLLVPGGEPPEACLPSPEVGRGLRAIAGIVRRLSAA